MADRTTRRAFGTAAGRRESEGLDDPTPRCGLCRTALELYQPMMEQPDELLGTCGNCGAWHFVGPSADGSRFVSHALAKPSGSGTIAP